MISDRQLEAYRRDGVICLRQAFDPDWVATTRAGIMRNKGQPGRFFRDHTPEGSPGRYVFDFWTWPEIPEFRDLVFDSPAGEIAAGLMGARRVAMVMDNWFMREAGATNGAPWHHDEPYFDFEGRLCILWMPLEPVSREEGLTFIRGSHRLGQLYIASQFSENVPFDGSADGYAEMPDFDAISDPDDRLSWDLAPGDCLAFDFRTIHAATSPAHALDQTIHRMTLRFGAEDTLFRPRGDWTREISDHLIAAGQTPGAVLGSSLTPWVWPREDSR